MNPNLIHPRTGARALGFRKSGAPIWPILGADGRSAGATLTQSPMLQRLHEERQTCVDFVDQTVAGANVEGQVRDLSDSEQESLKRTRERITALDAQIEPLEAFEQQRAAGNAAGNNYLRPTGPGTQQAASSLGARTEQRAWHYATAGEAIVDQLRAAPLSAGGQSDMDARDRLLSAGVVFAGANDDDVAQARSAAHRLAAETNQRMQTEKRATQVSGDSPGVLPVPIIGDIMTDVDGARPFITSVGAKSLAFAGETFKRPVVTQHSLVAKQATQATPVASQKMVIGSVTFTKETWGGFVDVSRQDIDWTSPSAWNALLTDLQEQYGLQTENAAADTFATAVAATPIEVAGTTATSTLKDWLTALYAGAAAAYSGAGRLPDTIWMSLDMWGSLGPLIDSQVAMNKEPGRSSLSTFSGMLTDLPRIVVPSFAAGTVIIGNRRWTEVYEERIGLLQAVLPSVLGVQIAYGGYIAYNTLKAAAFKTIVNTAA